MAKTLEQILGIDSMLGLIENVKTGLAPVLPPEFMKAGQQVNGDTGKYFKVEGTRQTAQLCHFGAPAKRRELAGVTEVPIKLCHAFETITHPQALMLALQNVDNEQRQKMGQQELARQTQLFKQRFVNLREAAAMSALFRGLVYFDSSGNLLPSASGASISVDYGIPAGNKNQLNILGAGNIIGASWATAATNIVAQMKLIKSAYRKKSGYSIGCAFYGENILPYFAGNTTCMALIAGSPAYSQSFLNQEIPDGFLGIRKWIPAEDAFFVDNDGTVQTLMPADGITFCPDPSPEWWDFVDGSFAVPTNLGMVGADGSAQAASLREAFGMFTYAATTHNPPTIEQFAGDTFLPLIKAPYAVLTADVTP